MFFSHIQEMAYSTLSLFLFFFYICCSYVFSLFYGILKMVLISYFRPIFSVWLLGANKDKKYSYLKLINNIFKNLLKTKLFICSSKKFK